MEPIARTPEQEKAALENAAITEQAHKMAAEARAREAFGKPLIIDVADSIKAKLEKLPAEETQQ